MTRRTKIIATLGPASSSPSMVRELIRAGMDAARINFSHGTREDHIREIQMVREIAREENRHVAIIQDLQGPKVRVGSISEGMVELKEGKQVALVPDEGHAGSAKSLPISYRGLSDIVHIGEPVLIDDGRVRLQVEGVHGEEVHCRVLVGGPVSNHKGVNFPGVSLELDCLTEKDRKDLALGISQDVDYVALSFVRSPEDVKTLRRELQEAGGEALIIAKIEKREALDAIDDVIDAADAVMVARGDLGVEIPAEEVPWQQKNIIRKVVSKGKSVITATQMLETMIQNVLPTRAEASDVANAVYDMTSALMLSGETAVGAHPVRVVETMSRIAAKAEEDPAVYGLQREGGEFVSEVRDSSVSQAISRAAWHLAGDLFAAAIITPTQSGNTPRQVARYRPTVPIIGTSPETRVLRRLSITWGVTPVLAEPAYDTDGIIGAGIGAARGEGLVSPGDRVVVTCGATVNVPGSTNLIKVESVPE